MLLFQTLNVLPSILQQASATQHPQEHQLEHWKMAESGHKKECKRLKAEKEAAEAEAEAELARLSRRGAGGCPSGAGTSGGRGSRRGSGSARAPRGATSGGTAGGRSAHGRVGAGGAFEVGELD